MRPVLQKRIDSFRNAFSGIRHLIQTESPARIHLVMSVAVMGIGLSLSISTSDWCLVTLAVGLVWAAEAVNTAIERLVDLSSAGHHPLAGQAKDLAAGAVLLAALAAAAVGLLVFLPRIAEIL